VIELSSDAFAALYLVANDPVHFWAQGARFSQDRDFWQPVGDDGHGVGSWRDLAPPRGEIVTWIWAGLAAGAVVGTLIALRISMTAMPQLVAALHSFVGLAAVLVAFGTFLIHQQKGELNSVLLIELAAGSFIGAITFTGSLIAFGKLQAILGSNPLVFKGQHFLNLALGVAMFGFAANFVIHQDVLSF